MTVSTVSTVIPVRNREQFIVRAIDSVVSQTYPSTDIIVVDDASTDETPHVVENLAKKFSNLVLIRLPENVGAAEARNIGAEAAKGDLLAFLDSDDRWYPEKLEKQINEFRTHKNIVAVSCGAFERTDVFSYEHIPPPEVSLMELYRSERLGTCSTAMVSKKAFAQVGGFDASLPSCQDWDISIRLAEIGKIRVVQEVLIEHYRHSGDRISSNKRDVLIGHNLVFNKIYKSLSNPILVRILRGGHEGMLAEILRKDEPRRAFVHALKAFALAPSPRKLQLLGEVVKPAVLAELRRLRVASVS
jgi:glycosyltransferase involved in cell wall biosynthesis